MIEFIKHWFTEKDGTSFCPVRGVAIIGALQFLVLAGVNHAAFTPESFGIGLGAVIAAVGAAVGLKASTEKA